MRKRGRPIRPQQRCQPAGVMHYSQMCLVVALCRAPYASHDLLTDGVHALHHQHPHLQTAGGHAPHPRATLHQSEQQQGLPSFIAQQQPPTTMRAATLLLTAAAVSVPTALAFLAPVPPSSSSSALARAGRAFSTPPRAAAFIEVEKTTGGGSGEEDENSRGGGGRGGGRATVITERAWNASTPGALPVDLEGLSKAVRVR